jgi:hypothetical protein
VIGTDDADQGPALYGSATCPPDLRVHCIAPVVDVGRNHEVLQHLGSAADVIRVLVRDPEQVNGRAVQV